MAATLDGMIQYGYATDDTFQREIGQACLDAAAAYLRNADVPEPGEDSPLYDLAVYMLAMHWYDNRGVTVLGQVAGPIAKGVQAIIHQLASP